jgi:hypothetical protein
MFSYVLQHSIREEVSPRLSYIIPPQPNAACISHLFSTFLSCPVGRPLALSAG